MRTRWESLYDSFVRTVRGGDSCSPRDDLTAHPSLRHFAGLQQLFAFLLQRASDLDERDRVLAALLELSRFPATRDSATALLWLALWPGLTSVYGRRRRRGFEPDDVVCAIAFAFTTQIHGLDLARVHRVAATLIRNTERDALAILCDHDEASASDEATDDIADVVPLDVSVRALRRDLLAVAGPDADLVLAVAVFGETQSEASTLLGISADAARKRYQRAVARIRAA